MLIAQQSTKIDLKQILAYIMRSILLFTYILQ